MFQFDHVVTVVNKNFYNILGKMSLSNQRTHIFDGKAFLTLSLIPFQKIFGWHANDTLDNLRGFFNQLSYYFNLEFNEANHETKK